MSRARLKTLAVSLYRSPRVRRDVYDIAKVVVGVIAAHYGVRLA